jgi:signal transduction histidine kinase
MTAFAGAGGRITLAQSANNSFNIAQDTAKNIEKLATDTKSNLQVSKNLQALIAVLADNGESATQVIIDGKNIATMIKRRNDNIKGRNIVEE